METYEHYYQPENPDDRERFVSAPKGQTELASFRLYTSHMRVLDEIIQSGIDPRLKTKSDCYQDAVSLFIEDWLKNYADGLSGRTLRMLRVERRENEANRRLQFLELMQSSFDRCTDEGDRDGFVNLIVDIEEEIDQQRGYCPNSYIEKLEKLLATVKEKKERLP